MTANQYTDTRHFKFNWYTHERGEGYSIKMGSCYAPQNELVIGIVPAPL